MSSHANEEAAPACCAATRPASERLRDSEPGHTGAGVASWTASKEGMVHLPGGVFLMGTEDGKGFPQDGEGPVRKITLSPLLDRRPRHDQR